MTKPAALLSTMKENIHAYIWRRRIRAANWLTRALTKGAMHAAPLHKVTVAGAAIFWFVENGQRKFLLMRDAQTSEKLRFASFVDFDDEQTAGEMMRKTVKGQFGDVFFKALNTDTLTGDSVIAAPTFHAKDDGSKVTVPLQALVWAVQITPEQAELAVTPDEEIELHIINEQAMQTELESAHRLIFQASLRHIHGHQVTIINNPAVDKLQDLLSTTLRSQRVLH
jgi:hypothetical protein